MRRARRTESFTICCVNVENAQTLNIYFRGVNHVPSVAGVMSYFVSLPYYVTPI